MKIIIWNEWPLGNLKQTSSRASDKCPHIYPSYQIQKPVPYWLHFLVEKNVCICISHCFFFQTTKSECVSDLNDSKQDVYRLFIHELSLSVSLSLVFSRADSCCRPFSFIFSRSLTNRSIQSPTRTENIHIIIGGTWASFFFESKNGSYQIQRIDGNQNNRYAFMCVGRFGWTRRSKYINIMCWSIGRTLSKVITNH